jgi:hypothetical protein
VGRSASLIVFGSEDGDARAIASAAHTTTKRLISLLIAATR